MNRKTVAKIEALNRQITKNEKTIKKVNTFLEETNYKISPYTALKTIKQCEQENEDYENQIESLLESL